MPEIYLNVMLVVVQLRPLQYSSQAGTHQQSFEVVALCGLGAECSIDDLPALGRRIRKLGNRKRVAEALDA